MDRVGILTQLYVFADVAYVGGGFGGKLQVTPEELIVFLVAKRLGKPSKYTETRSESMQATHHGRDQIQYLELAARRDGTVTGLKVELLADMGAYLRLVTPGVPILGAFMFNAIYKFPAYRFVCTNVFTNKTPTDAYRGAGRPQGCFVMERTIDRIAEHLGLSGHVAAEDFRAVLEGAEPSTGERLKARANRRVAAWDVTFSPPKSISALWAIAPDDTRHDVREAQAAAVDAAGGYLTIHACVARLGRDGVDRQDGSQLGFLRAEFTHRCSREADPQLHTHTILANLLQAPDGRRAALDGGLIFQHAKAADGIYQAALRAELTRRLGVAWEQRDEQWEIAGVPPGLCREWSKRRSQITAALVARGIDPDTASGRAAQTAARTFSTLCAPFRGISSILRMGSGAAFSLARKRMTPSCTNAP